MNKPIQLLILALGLGLCAITANADCPKCDDPGQPKCDQDGPSGPGDSMPEGVIVDDMPTNSFAES